MKYRKGFIYTLEAILASTLVLGVVLTVLPEAQQSSNTVPSEQVQSGLKSLDTTGELTDNLLAAEIESEIAPYVPDSYSHSVNIVNVESESDEVSGSQQHYIDTNGSYSEIQFWIKPSSNLDVSFNEEMIMEDYTGQGYEVLPVSSSEGWLNFTGSGELEYSFDSYSSNNVDEAQNQASEVSVTTYIVHKNGTKEIQVRLWN